MTVPHHLRPLNPDQPPHLPRSLNELNALADINSRLASLAKSLTDMEGRLKFGIMQRFDLLQIYVISEIQSTTNNLANKLDTILGKLDKLDKLEKSLQDIYQLQVVYGRQAEAWFETLSQYTAPR